MSRRRLGEDTGSPLKGRVRTLETVGRMVHTIGLSNKHLAPWEIRKIEHRALQKVEAALGEVSATEVNVHEQTFAAGRL